MEGTGSARTENLLARTVCSVGKVLIAAGGPGCQPTGLTPDITSISQGPPRSTG